MNPLYLSRCVLNLRRRDTQYDLQNCARMHSRILQTFPDLPDSQAAREHFGVLYRIEQESDGAILLVQSAYTPEWPRLPADYLLGYQIKRVDAAYETLSAGMRLRFRLRANPTKRISDRNLTQAAKWRGKRIELTQETDHLEWLHRHATTAGFTVLGMRTAPQVADAQANALTKQYGQRAKTGKVTIGTVLFEGRLQVTDPTLLQQALIHGIGSGKAYGCGLLSLAAD